MTTTHLIVLLVVGACAALGLFGGGGNNNNKLFAQAQQQCAISCGTCATTTTTNLDAQASCTSCILPLRALSLEDAAIARASASSPSSAKAIEDSGGYAFVSDETLDQVAGVADDATNAEKMMETTHYCVECLNNADCGDSDTARCIASADPSQPPLRCASIVTDDNKDAAEGGAESADDYASMQAAYGDYIDASTSSGGGVGGDAVVNEEPWWTALQEEERLRMESGGAHLHHTAACLLSAVVLLITAAAVGR
ncbi:hypothetical protein NFJ02_38g96210 [Pycnococcus provasolii]